MKKILALIIASTMIISLFVVLSVPAAAIDGDWIVYSKADHEMEDFEGDPMSIPGYEYTDEGLSVIPADWKDFTPGAGVRRKELSDITEGVYMQVRIDEFSYEADGWFNFNIYSQSKMKPGKTDVEKWGYGVQTLVRYRAANDDFLVEWKTGGFANSGNSTVPSDKIVRDDEGRFILDFTVEYDGNTFSIAINGVSAPNTVVAYMNELYTQEEAYVGFNLQNSVKGGKCACTVLKYGTSEANATEPAGDDSRDPWNNYISIAELAPATSVEAGEPAVFMNADRVNSDSKKSPVAGGGRFEVNEADYSSHAIVEKSSFTATFEVRNDVSYSIDDFPAVIILVKNLCTCEDDVECWGVESADLYLMTGEIIGADAQHKVKELYIMGDNTIVINGEKYLAFYYDMNDASWDAEGRINGARFDFNQILYNTPGRNSFDVIYSAFFASVDEAIAYTENYLTELGWNGEYGMPTDEDETDTPVSGGDETEAPAGNETEAPAGNEIDAPAVGGEETKAPAGNETEAPAGNNGSDNTASSGGCGAFAGFGAIAIITIAASVGFVSFKKRK